MIVELEVVIVDEFWEEKTFVSSSNTLIVLVHGDRESTNGPIKSWVLIHLWSTLY